MINHDDEMTSLTEIASLTARHGQPVSNCQIDDDDDDVGCPELPRGQNIGESESPF